MVLRFLAAPTDVNWGGKVHGGIVMRWIDEAAHVLATRWTGSAANVAVYAGGVRFYRPLRIGHLVEVDARLLHTGSTSMHISVHVRSGDPATSDMDVTTHCLIVFVPLTGSGQAAPCPFLDTGLRRGRRTRKTCPAPGRAEEVRAPLPRTAGLLARRRGPSPRLTSTGS